MNMKHDEITKALHDAGVAEDAAALIARFLEPDGARQVTKHDLEEAAALLKSEVDEAVALLRAELGRAVAQLDQQIAAFDQQAGRELQLLRDDLMTLRAELGDLGRHLRAELRELRGEIEAARAEAGELNDASRAESRRDLSRLRAETRWLFGIVIALLIAFAAYYVVRGGL